MADRDSTMGPGRPARGRDRSGRRRRASPPAVERLERLVMPSTFVVTSTADSGAGSLRQAIINSNAAVGGLNTITFNIPGTGVQIIATSSFLPAIRTPVALDATTQPGYAGTPRVALNGSSAGAGAAGLVITSSAAGSSVRGLDIGLFGGNGIDVQADNVTIAANFIGTGPTGLTAAANHGDGIVIRGSNNTIGGPNAASRNLIAANGLEGILIGGSNNVVQGNLVGTNLTGNAALGNHGGVLIQGGSGNTIGGTAPGAGNVLSGNATHGFYSTNSVLPPPTAYSRSAGPLTLTDVAYNAGYSLSVFAYAFPTVNGGGVVGPSGIAFPPSGGVLVADFDGTVRHFPTDVDGQDARTITPVTWRAGTAGMARIGNTLYMAEQFADDVVQVDDAGRKIQTIVGGLDFATGLVTDTTPGPLNGHLFVTTQTNGVGVIYDVDPVARTKRPFLPVKGDGMSIDPVANVLYVANRDLSSVQGFDLDTKAKVFDSGTIAGDPDGIAIDPVAGVLYVNTNGGTVVQIPLNSPTTHTLIASGGTRGDFIAVDPYNGTLLLTQSTFVARLILGPGGGLQGGPPATTAGNVVQGNKIGVGVDGQTRVGNAVNGVAIVGGTTATAIGGTAPGAGNVIAANGQYGVVLLGQGTAGTIVRGNAIGTDATGTMALGNANDGVHVDTGAGPATIGGDSAGAGNLIAHNGRDGVFVNGTTTLGVALRGNRIVANAALGIDVVGQAGQSIPVISAAYAGVSSTRVVGTARGRPNSTLTLDFYADAVPDPSGYGQGEFYLGTSIVPTDAVTGAADFDVILPAGTSVGESITATATDPTAGTSGYARDVLAVQPVLMTAVVASPNPVSYGHSVQFTATIAGTPPAGGTVQFQVDGVDFASSVTIVNGRASSGGIATFGVGPHAISAIYSGDGQHAGMTLSATLTVTKAHLTVAADPKSKSYGDPVPALTYTLTGFVNGDTVAVVQGAPDLSTGATAGSGVGSYPITVGPGTLAADNYDFRPADGTLTVSRAHLTVTADPEERLYGGPPPPLTSTLSGFVNGDGPGVVTGAAALATTATAASGVGSYPITIGPGTLSAINYDFPNFLDNTLTIDPAHLTVRADDHGRPFGVPNPPLTYSISGFVNHDVPAAVTGRPTLSTTATPASPVGRYSIAIAIGTLAAANYDFPSLIGGTLTVSTPGDFDGDGRADLVVYRPPAAQWLLIQSSAGGRVVPFGQPGVDIPLAGDFDGDGKQDLAVYRPTTARWLILYSSGGSQVLTFGQPGVDVAVPADYDGDGKADLAVYRPTTATYLILRSTAGGLVQQFGQPNVDQPAPADFDGDGRVDLAVFRPTTATWLVFQSTAGGKVVQMGQPGVDRPIPADFDGDGKADLAVFRPTTATYLILQSSAGGKVVQFGQPYVDVPVPADYDGDGRADLAVFRPTTATWLIFQSTAGGRVLQYGQGGVDVPVTVPLAYRYEGGLHALGLAAGPPPGGAPPSATKVLQTPARVVDGPAARVDPNPAPAPAPGRPRTVAFGPARQGPAGAMAGLPLRRTNRWAQSWTDRARHHAHRGAGPRS